MKAIVWISGFASAAALLVACSNGGTLTQCYDTTTGQGIQCQDNQANQPLSTEAKDIDGDGEKDRFVCADRHRHGSDGDSDSDSDTDSDSDSDSDHKDGGVASIAAKLESDSNDDGDRDSDSDSSSKDDDHDGISNHDDCDIVRGGDADAGTAGGGSTGVDSDAGVVIE